MAKIISVNVSLSKGIGKKAVQQVDLRPEHGITGDAHAGAWHRQISLLAVESIEEMNARGASLKPGDFAENITTQGIDLPSLPVGTRLVVGEVELEVTQIGKKCHSKCAIHKTVGDCVMPKQGIFAQVIRGGRLSAGQEIVVKG
ncbi:MOSC domain-containing protein [Thiovibrio sp. JS02]